MPRRVSNPPNPWRTAHVELLGEAPQVELEVYEEEAKSIVAENDSPDVSFRFSVNPYRGCFHACAYCYARPTHQYLDWGAGTDFDRRIVAKVNAAELLREELARGRAGRETIAFSGVTDCYQPLEAHYGLTRACLTACAEFRQPVGIVTKGALIERDVDVLLRLRERARAAVTVSIPFADDADGRAIEPFAAPPSRRFETLARLSRAGVDTGIAVAPLIPGLNDHAIPELLERAHAAGARRASITLLRLPDAVLPVFEARLREAFPDRAKKVFSVLAAMRGGAHALQESRFGKRMAGSGARWDAVAQLFAVQCKRLGLATSASAVDVRDPELPQQGSLFG